MKKKLGWLRIAAAAVVVAVLSAAVCGDEALKALDAYYYGQDGLVPVQPKVTGTFIQPWLAEGWTDEDWDAHLDRLLSAGIDTVILQWTADTSGGSFTYAALPKQPGWKTADGYKEFPDLTEGLLKSAERKGVKVFVGLNTADEWWNNAFSDEGWRKAEAEAGNLLAKALYDQYKAKYPHAFTGWYWPWEMYGNPFGYGKPWAEMLNANIAALNTLDASMPLLLSPFMSAYIRLSPAEEERMWTDFLAMTDLRPGDIFCPQDSVGGEVVTLKQSGKALAAMKKAAGTRPGLLFWVNNETFTADFKPAPMERFLSQLYVSGRYTDTHMCFAYSHYYDPAVVNDPSYDAQYKAYLAGGVTAALGK